MFVGALDDSLVNSQQPPNAKPPKTQSSLQITIASSVSKHTPVYKLTVRQSEHSNRPPFMWKSKEISSPFTRWFTADGYFVAEPFQQWLSEEVEMIAAADQKLGKKSTKGESESDPLPIVESKVPALEAEQLPTKRSKRGKR